MEQNLITRRKKMNKYKPYLSAYLNKIELMKLSTKKLEQIGKTKGIDLDRRYKKETLVDQLYKVL